jgi:hypothetical protein
MFYRFKGLAVWGNPESPLLPASLRELWQYDSLPTWVLEEAGLPLGATIASLNSSVWKGMVSCSTRLRNYLIRLLALRRHQIVARIVFPDPLPVGFEPARLPLQVRTRNALKSSGLFESESALSLVTYGQLFKIKGMGAASILDFVCTTESAISAQAAEMATETPTSNADSVESNVASFTKTNIEDAKEESVDRALTAREVLLSVINESWVHQISEQDPRFARLLPPGEGTIAERIEALFAGPPTAFFADEIALQSSIVEIRREYDRIDSLPLDVSLREYMSALMRRTSGPRLEALISRFGWGGRPPLTLEEAAKGLGLTRERIRQIQSRILSRMPDHEVAMPALDRALEIIQRNAPLSPEAAANLLVKHRISEHRFSVTSLLEVCKMCFRTPPFQVVQQNEREFVTTSSLQALAGPIIRAANAQAGASGVSNIQEVTEECLHKGFEVSEKDVREVLDGLSDVEFLNDDWFWKPSGKRGRNRLRNVTRRMLSVSSPISLGDLREGVRREFSWRATRSAGGWRLLVPPRSVLEAFYRANPEFAVTESGLVSSVEPLDYRIELSRTDQILVRVFRASPTCILDRSGFQKGCIESGMNENTFAVYSSYHPIIQHLGTDLWSLRGVHLDPVAVQAMRAANLARPRQKRIVDHGWTWNGHLWIGVRLPSSVRGFIFSVPSAIRRLIEDREFSALSEKGVPSGSIRVNSDGTCYGSAKFLSSSGADEGDIFVTEFDLEHDMVTLRLGGDELLDEYSPEN